MSRPFIHSLVFDDTTLFWLSYFSSHFHSFFFSQSKEISLEFFVPVKKSAEIGWHGPFHSRLALRSFLFHSFRFDWSLLINTIHSIFKAELQLTVNLLSQRFEGWSIDPLGISLNELCAIDSKSTALIGHNWFECACVG